MPRKDTRNIQSYKTKDGQKRWRVQMRTASGRVNRSFASEHEALCYRNRLAEARSATPSVPRGGEHVPARSPDGWHQMSLARFIEEIWWPAEAERELAKRTQVNYRNHLHRWIAPAPLGALPISAVEAEDICDWHDWARERGAKNPTLRTAQKVLSKALSWAEKRTRRTGVRSNAASRAGWPKERRSIDVEVFGPDIVEMIRREILGSSPTMGAKRDAVLFSLMALTGMRPCDARSVRLCDVNSHVIRVPDPKNNEPREVPLWAPLAADIRDWAQVAGLGPSDYIAGKLDGSKMTESGWDNFRKQAFDPTRDAVAAKTGDRRLRGARAYDVCRHSYAALQFKALMSVSELAEIMGHDVAVLSSTYSTVLKEQKFQEKRIDPEAVVIAAREAAIKAGLTNQRQANEHASNTAKSQPPRPLGFPFDPG